LKSGPDEQMPLTLLDIIVLSVMLLSGLPAMVRGPVPGEPQPDRFQNARSLSLLKSTGSWLMAMAPGFSALLTGLMLSPIVDLVAIVSRAARRGRDLRLSNAHHSS
jgi:hypothetical protein